MNTIAVYPGSFDPITNGHLDIVARAAAVFDTVIIGVLANPRKAPLLAVETRIEVIRDALARRRRPAARTGSRSSRVRRPDRRLLPRARGRLDRPRPARDQRLRDRDAARPQQPRPRARRRHGLLHDLGRERLRQLEPGQGDRELRRRRVDDGPGRGRRGAAAATARLTGRDRRCRRAADARRGVPYLQPA